MTTDSSAPIGVFDSGIGGLTVAKEIIRNLPGENMIYFGDTARVPYGNKSKATIVRYSKQITDFLLKQNVKAIVIACNTATALAIEELEKNCPVPIIGVVDPGTRAAIAATKNKRIGVIATRSTIESGIYSRKLSKMDPEAEIFGKACPLFVPLAEEGMKDDIITEMVAQRYLKELIDINIDTLIMGCTHYPILRKLLMRVCGEGITLVNPAYETAISLKAMLEEKGMLNTSGEPAKYKFYASDTIEKFTASAEAILPVSVDDAEQYILA